MRPRATRGYILLLAMIPAAMAVAPTARADEVFTERGHGFYAALSVATDEADISSTRGELGLPLGDNAWVQLDLGTITASWVGENIDTTIAGLGLGFTVGRVDFGGKYTYREDDGYTQHDLESGFTYVGARHSLGLDLFYRSADDETVTSIERRFRDPLAFRVLETTEGVGMGVHGDVLLTQRVMLFGSAAVYDYDYSSSLPARLARLRRVQLSGVTRDEAYLRDSVNVGLTYDFDALSVSAAYYRDSLIDDAGVTDTAELSADVPLGQQWLLLTWIGHSITEEESGITYGGARISVVW